MPMEIKKLNQISTKVGDDGQSRNYNNIVYSKDDILFEVLGSVDELSSFLGLTYHEKSLKVILDIQKHLQLISSLLATMPLSDIYSKLKQLSDQDVLELEEEIQILLDKKPLNHQFYLPGSEKTKVGAYFDVCRTLARRCERKIIAFVNKYQRSDLQVVKKYVNRLSDLLFLLSFIEK